MSRRVYIGNLPIDATKAQLCELLRPHGRVCSARVSKGPESGIAGSRGVIEMASDKEAAAAALALRSMYFGGRILTVNLARRDNEERSWDGRSGGLANLLHRT